MISLSSDGEINGELTGTWTQTESKPYIKLMIGNTTYEAVMEKQYIEGTHIQTLCLTGVGNDDICIWGYHYPEDEAVVAYNAYKFLNATGSISVQGINGIPQKGYFGATLTKYAGDSEAAIDITSGSVSYRKKYSLTTTVALTGIPDANVLATYQTTTAFNEDLPKQVNAATGLSIGFFTKGITNDWDTFGGTVDQTYAMHFSVLSGNDVNIYEAAATSYVSGAAYTAFYNKEGYATISFNTDGSVSYYLNGKLALKYAANSASGSVKVSDIARNVISKYKAGKLILAPNIWNTATGIVVGYAVDCDASKVEFFDDSSYLYYADYDNAGTVADWTVDTNITADSDDMHGLYAKLTASSGRGPRGAMLDITEDLDVSDRTGYTVEADIELRSTTEKTKEGMAFYLFEKDSVSAFNGNLTPASDKKSGYIFKMRPPTYSDTSADVDFAWFLNDAESSSFVMDGTSWVHFKAVINKETKKVSLTLTKEDNSSLYTGEVSFAGSGELGGIFIDMPRGNSPHAYIDNIKVY